MLLIVLVDKGSRAAACWFELAALTMGPSRRMSPLLLVSSAASDEKLCEASSQVCTAALSLLLGCLALLQPEATRSSKLLPGLPIASAPAYCVRAACSLRGDAFMLRSKLWGHLNADSAATSLFG